MGKRKLKERDTFPRTPENAASSPAKERIIGYAREKFLREGFSGVTVDEIAGDLLISKKTFYRNFDTKEELLTAVVDSVIGSMALGVGAIVAGEQPFLPKLSTLMEFVAKRVSSFGRPFFWDLQRSAPHQWKRVQEFRRTKVVPNLMSLIDQGVREGYIRKDINSRVLLMSFLATIEAVLVPSVLANEPFSSDEAVRGILRLFFHGLLTNDASDEFELLDRQSLSQHG